MQHFLRHFLVPHQSNNHRAKALHTDSLLCYVLLLAVFNLGIRIVHRQFPEILGYATDIRVEQLLSETNKERAALGLSELRFNSILSEAAAEKAKDMFMDNYWAHNSPKGKTPWSFIVNSGYHYTLAGENLAKNFDTSRGVVDAWMTSQTHRDNIIKPGYNDVGFAVVNGVLNGEETTLVVQMFGAGGEIAEAPKTKSVVPKESAVTEEKAPQVSSSVLSQVTAPSEVMPFLTAVALNKPRFNIPTVTRDVVFLFIGLIVGILAIDGIVVSRKKIIRIAGHNVAHIVFFLSLFVALTIVKRGVLL